MNVRANRTRRGMCACVRAYIHTGRNQRDATIFCSHVGIEQEPWCPKKGWAVVQLTGGSFPDSRRSRVSTPSLAGSDTMRRRLYRRIGGGGGGLPDVVPLTGADSVPVALPEVTAATRYVYSVPLCRPVSVYDLSLIHI